MRFGAVIVPALLFFGGLYFLHIQAHVAEFESVSEDHGLSGPRDEGEKAFYSHDWNTSLKLWQPLADQGNAAAQNNIGVLYERGLGVKQDYAEAVKWYRKAADQGDDKAEWGLGGMYLSGRGVKSDPTEALRWFRKSADQGDALLQFNLGGVYEEGRGGIKQDYAEALKWFRKAAADQRLTSSAQKAIASTYARDQNCEEAAKWLQKPADRGDVDAQMSLGDYYQEGKGVKQDWAEAYFWYKVGEKNDGLGGMLPHEVDEFWDSIAIDKHLLPGQIWAVNKRVSEWKPTPAQPPAPARMPDKPETKYPRQKNATP